MEMPADVYGLATVPAPAGVALTPVVVSVSVGAPPWNDRM